MMQRIDYPTLGEELWAGELENGLPVLVIPKPGYRRTFAMLAANYGAADRRFTLAGQVRETPAGVAHYLEHKLFDMPEGDALLTMSAAGADPNAFTSESITAYHFECTDRFEDNLRVLLTFVTTPWFTPESVEKERGIIAQEIRMYEDSPDYAAYTDLMRCLFPTGPLRDSVAGTVRSISEITPELLYDCHRVFYRPSNLALCVVGNVDPLFVERTAAELLPPEREELPGRSYDDAGGLRPVTARASRRMEVSAPQFIIGAKLGPAAYGAAAQRERLTAGLALRCLCGSSSPFYLKNYSEGLLNDTFGYDVDHAAGQSIVAFDGETPGDPEAVLDALREELLRARRDGLDPALFARQKRAVLGARVRALTNFEGLAQAMVTSRFAGFCAMDGTGVLGTISCEDAAVWLREHLDPDQLAMAVVLPKEG